MSRRLYEVLGVEPAATAEDLKRAWKEAARRYHPDHNPDDAYAAARFREVRAAWEVLGDPERRSWYDEFGEDATSAFFDPDLARAARAARAPGPAADPKRPARRRYAVTRGEDLEASLHLDGREAARGGVFEVVLRPARRCPACDGTGWRPGGRACSKCEGGTLPGLGPWRVQVPPGVRDGQRLCVHGEGRAGRGHGAAPGDLWITCRVPATFSAEGSDVVLDVPTRPEQRRQGGRVRVPLPDGGAVRVKVPPGCAVGQRLRLRGKGRRGGDLYVRLVDAPEPRTVQAVRVMM